MFDHMPGSSRPRTFVQSEPFGPVCVETLVLNSSWSSQRHSMTLNCAPARKSEPVGSAYDCPRKSSMPDSRMVGPGRNDRVVCARVIPNANLARVTFETTHEEWLLTCEG